MEPLAHHDATGLVISEVTEFVNRVMTTTASSLAKKNELAKSPALSTATTPAPATLSTNALPTDMHDGDDHTSNASLQTTMKEEATERHTVADSVIRDEPLVSQGIGATLELLRRKGTLATPTLEQKKESEAFAHRQKWLAEHAVLESAYDAQVKKDKALVRGSNVTKSGSAAKREREEAEKKAAKLIADRERERQRIVEERLKDYKPQAKLEYFDEMGRTLEPKDASPHFSFQCCVLHIPTRVNEKLFLLTQIRALFSFFLSFNLGISTTFPQVSRHVQRQEQDREEAEED